MKTVKELRSKIQNVIWKEQEPEQLANLIQEILVQYKECYNEYIQRVRAIIEPNEEENVNNILKYIQRDYQETVEMLKTIELAEEGYRKKEIEEIILPTIDKITNGIQNANSESFKEQDIILKEDIVKAKRNKRYISEIKSNVISELKSSKSMIIQKSKDIEVDKKKLRVLQEELERKMQVIINNASSRLDKMQLVMEERDIKMYNEILQLLEEYYKESTELELSKLKPIRQDFIKRISENVKVDQTQIVQNANGDNMQQIVRDMNLEEK